MSDNSDINPVTLTRDVASAVYIRDMYSRVYTYLGWWEGIYSRYTLLPPYQGGIYRAIPFLLTYPGRHITRKESLPASLGKKKNNREESLPASLGRERINREESLPASLGREERTLKGGSEPWGREGGITLRKEPPSLP